MTSSEHLDISRAKTYGPSSPAAPPQEPHDYDPYAPTTWGQYDEELTVNSGQKCRVRKLDFGDVMDAGLLDKLNTLQGVVDKHQKKAEGQPPVDPMKLLADKRTARQFSTLIDDVVIMCVTAPKLEKPPADFAKRKPGVVYVDTVGLVDKMEIFGHALGDINALESFRVGPGKPAGGMADGQDAEGAS